MANDICCQESHNHVPNADQWYHGQISREEAENLLRDSGCGCSFLVRQRLEDSNYALSYITEDHHYLHYRITVVGLLWVELGGRAYRDLKCLVSRYYDHDIRPNERLKYPVLPKLRPIEEERESEERVIAKMPYSKRPNTHELTFKAGDLFVVDQRQSTDGWLWVYSLATRRVGFVHSKLMDKSNYSEAVERLNFFHPGPMSSDEIKEQMVNSGPESYMLRPSDSRPGSFTLYFFDGIRVIRFKIAVIEEGRRFRMANSDYDSIESLVEVYKNESIVEEKECYLIIPVTRRREHPESSRDEEIYESVRQSMQAPPLVLNDQVLIHGGLLKYNKKKKKWKRYYATLDSNQGLLNYQELKPHRITYPIRLSSMKYIPVHDDSLYERKFCFQLVADENPSDPVVDVFSVEAPSLANRQCQELSVNTYAGKGTTDADSLCSNDECFLRWLQELRRFCKNTSADCVNEEQRNSGTRHYRELWLQITEARTANLSIKGTVACHIAINKHHVARTQMVDSNNAVWNQEFIFKDLPADLRDVTLSFHVKGKKSDIGSQTVTLSKVSSPLDISDVPVTICGANSVRCKIRYKDLNVLPFKRYTPLMHTLIDQMDANLVPLNEFSFTNVSQLARCLFNIAIYKNKHIEMIIRLFQEEITKKDNSSLFRRSTLATALLDEYMSRVADGWLVACLSHIVDEVHKLGNTCPEVDPEKIEKADNLEDNRGKLKALLTLLIEDVLNSVAECPLPLRYIYTDLQERVMQQCPRDSPSLQWRLVCNLIFLRLICPPLASKHDILVRVLCPPGSSMFNHQDSADSPLRSNPSVTSGQNAAGSLASPTSGNHPRGGFASGLILGARGDSGGTGSDGLTHSMSLMAMNSPSSSMSSGNRMNSTDCFSEQGKRTFTLLAKGLIALPAESLLGRRELYMAPLEPVIQVYKENGLPKFVEEITKPLTQEQLAFLSKIRQEESTTLICRVSLSREMADIHHMLHSQLELIRQTACSDLVEAVEAINLEPASRNLNTDGAD